MRDRNLKLVVMGQGICTAAMMGVFALLGQFDHSVFWGGLAGGLLAAANFFVMTLAADQAARKAQEQDVAGGQKLLQLSYLGRMAGLFLLLILCTKSGLFDLLALVIPLTFTRPVLTAVDAMKKKGGKPHEHPC